MELIERNYAGRGRSLPIAEVDAENKLILVATPWGPRTRCESVMSAFKDQFLSGQVDPEITMPFDRLTCLSTTANDLRIAMKVTNDGIYYNDNKESYNFALEFLAISIGEKELAVANVGGPTLFIQRNNLPLAPISISTDMSAEYAAHGSLLSSLPSELLGVESSSSITIKSTRYSQGDRLIMISRAHIPSQFYHQSSSEFNIDEISQLLTSDDPQQSYWLASLVL